MAEFPYEFTPMSKEEYMGHSELEEAALLVPGLVSPGYERLGPIGYVVKAGKREVIRRIQNLEVTKEDIWVVTYPRSGTTWTQEMIWNILNGCNFDSAKKVDIDQKFFFLDMDWLGDSEYITACEAAKGQRRLIKSHLPLSLLPPTLLTTCRVIYVGRNPKDVAVSYYHHHRLTRSASPDMTFSQFLKLFMAELLVQGPHLSAVQEGVEAGKAGELLFLWYEDMKADLGAAVRRVAAYLGQTITEEQVTRLTDYLDIKNMKKNPAVNHADRHAKGRFLEGESFVRRGAAGGWREEFTEEMEEQFQAWLDTKGCNIPFHWS